MREQMLIMSSRYECLPWMILLHVMHELKVFILEVQCVLLRSSGSVMEIRTGIHSHHAFFIWYTEHRGSVVS